MAEIVGSLATSHTRSKSRVRLLQRPSHICKHSDAALREFHMH